MAVTVIMDPVTARVLAMAVIMRAHIDRKASLLPTSLELFAISQAPAALYEKILMSLMDSAITSLSVRCSDIAVSHPILRSNTK